MACPWASVVALIHVAQRLGTRRAERASESCCLPKGTQLPRTFQSRHEGKVACVSGVQSGVGVVLWSFQRADGSQGPPVRPLVHMLPAAADAGKWGCGFGCSPGVFLLK